MKTHHILIVAVLLIFTISLPLFAIMRSIETVECKFDFPPVTLGDIE